MAERNLLSVSKIEEFASWAIKQGFEREPTKGIYEVLRLRFPGASPLIYFTRDRTARGGECIHVTAQNDGAQLVRRWLRRRQK